MGLLDRIRAWFKGETKREGPSRSRQSPSSSPASREARRDLEEFIGSRPGVEGYLEPKTAIYSTTLLVVAADGEYLRRPVDGRRQASKLCGKFDIPLYDAAKVGYPKRMRDYDLGIKRDGVSLDELPPWPGDDDVRPPGQTA